MSNRVNQSRSSNSSKRSNIRVKSNVGVVIDVILNAGSPYLMTTSLESVTSGKSEWQIGSVLVKRINGDNSNNEDLQIVPPMNNLDVDMPIRGELVELSTTNGVIGYRRIASGALNVGNTTEGVHNKLYPVDGDDDAADILQFGNYFKEQKINNLTLYEGDRLIQSRFGQSIRFSGYNNPENLFAPTMIIRNRQSDIVSNDMEVGDFIDEDINRDGSVILMTSGDQIINFQPGTVDSNGSSNFKTKPERFSDYPSELKGMDQMLINSDRLIFSSKSAEMIFYSKGNIGFITDSNMSIDAKGSANLTFSDNVLLETDSGDVTLLTDGSVLLNTDSTDEPLIRGSAMVDLLGELIDAITKQVYSTPAGPSSTGPINIADFMKMKSKLAQLKSTKNFTE